LATIPSARCLELLANGVQFLDSKDLSIEYAPRIVALGKSVAEDSNVLGDHFPQPGFGQRNARRLPWVMQVHTRSRYDRSPCTRSSPPKSKSPIHRKRIHIIRSEADQNNVRIICQRRESSAHTGNQPFGYKLLAPWINCAWVNGDGCQRLNVQVEFLTVVLNELLDLVAWEITDGDEVDILSLNPGSLGFRGKAAFTGSSQSSSCARNRPALRP